MRMKTAGLGTKKHVLENDISKEYTAAIRANGATHELVPLEEHRRNIAAKSIQTYKNHFVGVLAGLHESFPMHLWCRLITQAEMQLNIQRQYTITPKISVYSHVHGPHNFIYKPLAPLVCPVLAHENLDKRVSWEDHAINACNLYMSMEHHQAFNVYSKHKRSERIFDTLFFKHKYPTHPIVTPKDTAKEAADILTDAVTDN